MSYHRAYCCRCNQSAMIRVTFSGVDSSACAGCVVLAGVFPNGSTFPVVGIDGVMITLDGTHDLVFAQSALEGGNRICRYAVTVAGSAMFNQRQYATCTGTSVARTENLTISVRYNKTLGVIDQVSAARQIAYGSGGMNYSISAFFWTGLASIGATLSNQEVCGDVVDGIANGGTVTPSFL